MLSIPFNKPYSSGSEIQYILDVIQNGKISGDGIFTKKCHRFFEEKFGFKKVLLTTSCTDALEMAAILIDIQPGDEVIVPSYTFVSTCNAFVLRGATIVFADSKSENPNLDVNTLRNLITSRTKAIVPVHYGGVACDMDAIMKLASEFELFVIEDAAPAIDSYYEARPLGSIGHLAAFSFHETKNIVAGEGGMLVINDEQFIKRAEIIRDKGTNRAAFLRGEVDKYGWVDMGSSFLPSDIIAAYLWSQLENLHQIQGRRKALWERYNTGLQELEKAGKLRLPYIPDYATNNGHMFYVVCNSLEERSHLIEALKEAGIYAVFHYLSLHKSPYYAAQHDGRELPNCDHYADCLVRLPLFFELSDEQVDYIVENIKKVFDLKPAVV